MTLASFDVAGVRIHALRVSDVVDEVDTWIRERRREYVVLTGAHGVVEMQDDESLRRINNVAGLTAPDGMPVVWLGRLSGHPHVEQCAAPQIMQAIFSISAERGYRHFLYGGAAGVADELSAALRRRFGRVTIAGAHGPPFRALTAAEISEDARRINDSGADIVWVGLGCPKQERWMATFRPLLTTPVLIGVGAGFDFFTGRLPRSPRWVSAAGLEWLFRLAVEPRRLWPRYSRVVPKFLYTVAREWLRPNIRAVRD